MIEVTLNNEFYKDAEEAILRCALFYNATTLSFFWKYN